MADPMILHVIMLDTYRTRMGVLHENGYVPYRKRLVTVPLTREQCTALQARCVGSEGGREVHEEIGEVWLETEE